jgi:hypothetical protein
MDEGTLKTHCLLGWRSNFVGSESGQKQSTKLLQNMVYNTKNSTPTAASTHCLYILYIYFGKGGGRSERSRGATELEFLDNVWELGTGKE